MTKMDEFYNKILNWDNLIEHGYLNFINDRGNKTISSFYDYDPYSNYHSLLSGYFNLIGLLKNKKIFRYIVNGDYNKCVIEINKNKKIYKILNDINYTTPILYTIPKNDKTRRPLKYPNLYSYLLLVSYILNNDIKEDIITALENDQHSTSKYFGYKPYNFEITHRIQDKILFGYTYFYKTDFSNFYHTFYTHAIAWLINGKENAKKIGKKLTMEIC